MLNGIISVCNVLVQALCTRTLELERLKSDWSSYTATLTSEHSSSLNSERARALDTQATAQVGFEQEKKNMELAHQAKVRVSGREWKGRGERTWRQRKVESGWFGLSGQLFHKEWTWLPSFSSTMENCYKHNGYSMCRVSYRGLGMGDPPRKFFFIHSLDMKLKKNC